MGREQEYNSSEEDAQIEKHQGEGIAEGSSKDLVSGAYETEETKQADPNTMGAEPDVPRAALKKRVAKKKKSKTQLPQEVKYLQGVKYLEPSQAPPEQKQLEKPKQWQEAHSELEQQEEQQEQKTRPRSVLIEALAKSHIDRARMAVVVYELEQIRAEKEELSQPLLK